MITDKNLVLERPHALGIGEGVQRLYKLANGYGLSLVNNPELHAYPFAWEAAVVKGMTDAGKFDGITYDTPLTEDVEVFSTEAETNAFIDRAIAWSEQASE